MSPAKILVVDDDRNLVELLKMTLESADYEVTAAFNEKDAIGAVKENVFDLSIVDLQLGHGRWDLADGGDAPHPPGHAGDHPYRPREH